MAHWWHYRQLAHQVSLCVRRSKHLRSGCRHQVDAEIDARLSGKARTLNPKRLGCAGSFHYSFDLLPDGQIAPTALKGKWEGGGNGGRIVLRLPQTRWVAGLGKP
jgi:hypothetical protein